MAFETPCVNPPAYLRTIYKSAVKAAASVLKDGGARFNTSQDGKTLSLTEPCPAELWERAKAAADGEYERRAALHHARRPA